MSIGRDSVQKSCSRRNNDAASLHLRRHRAASRAIVNVIFQYIQQQINSKGGAGLTKQQTESTTAFLLYLLGPRVGIAGYTLSRSNP